MLYAIQRLALLVLVLAVMPTKSLADCQSVADACTDRAFDKGERCSDRCDRYLDSLDDKWTTCTDQCSATQDQEDERCDQAFEQCIAKESDDQNSSPPASASSLYGSKDSGEDGCYFGECPGGQEPPEQQTPRSTPRQSPQPTTQPPDPAPNPPTQSYALSAICQTPTFWCAMYARGAVGLPCYCVTPLGPAGGVVVPER